MSPQMAPLILGVSLVIRYRFLPIFPTFLGQYRESRQAILLTVLILTSQSPREYDDRLPLDVDLSLDLVIPL